MYRVRQQLQANDKECNTGGTGTYVAVLDSGVSNHPDLYNRVIEFHDFVQEKKEAYDDLGHGTHICGIIAGDGTLSEGRYAGIAPKSKLIVGKVLDCKGNGDCRQMLNALDWVEKITPEYPIRIINISIGIGNTVHNRNIQILKNRLNSLWEKGYVLVISAGNNGPGANTLSELAEGEHCICVGCHDGDFFKNFPKRCEMYSGRGGSSLNSKKPDVVAPGTEIISCNGFYTGIGQGNRAYCAKSGTSMATAIVSGCVARLFEANPQLTNNDVLSLIREKTVDLKLPFEKQGYGMVNLRKLLTGMV